ncbi:MAG: hypothetical protein ACC645_18720 [Pirellulales bacterium]
MTEALQKLDVTDGDGVADERRKLFGRFNFIGIGNDLPGTILGPDGRLYRVHGRGGGEYSSIGRPAFVSTAIPLPWDRRRNDTCMERRRDGMARGQLIICEQTGEWVGPFRRECGRFRPNAQWVRIGQTRSLHDARLMLDSWPASLLAIEVTTDSFPRILEEMPDAARHFPRMIWVALDVAGLGEAAWGLREAGALHVAGSPRDLAPAVDLAVRYLKAPPLPHCWMTDPIREKLDLILPANRSAGDPSHRQPGA